MRRTLVLLGLLAGCEYEGGLLGRIEPLPSCSADALSFVGVEGPGTLAAKTLVLGNEGDTTAHFTLEEDASWLELSDYSPTSAGPGDDAAVDVTPDLTDLSPGVYAATIWVRCGEWVEAVEVELIVALAGSNVIYVSMDRGDDGTGDGSFQDPYKTVKKGRDELLPPGLDTVYILPADQAYSASEGEVLPIELVDGTTVTAPGAEYVEISGEGSSGVFTVSSGQSSCTLSGVTVSQGNAATGGGFALTNASSVTLTDSVFESCQSTGNGGAVRADGGCTASFSRCVFRSNSAQGDGGAVSDGAGSVYDDCIFEANTATFEGGGAACAAAQFTRCVFSGNTAGNSGGGCFLGGGGTLSGCTLDSNIAGTNGGAVYAGGALTADGLIVLSNSASVSGGGVYLSGGGTIDNSAIDSNSAQDGAGIYTASASVDIGATGGCSITNNVASGKGGGVYLSVGGTVTRSTIASNRATDGGGLYADGRRFNGDTLDVLSNTATGAGGGVYLAGAFVAGGDSMGLGQSAIDSNTAAVGGGVYVKSTNNTFIGRSNIINNHATTSGGGIAFDSTVGPNGSMFHECDVRYNTADVTGGGIYVTGGSTVAMRRHYVVGNSALSGGGMHIQNGVLGGQWDQFCRNNLIALNQGGGILFSSGSLDVRNCAVVDNDGDGLRNTSMAVASLDVANSIFWGNDDDLDSVLDTDVSYCDIEDLDDLGDSTVLHADPLFVDRAGEDYHLGAGSPCIDAANGDVAPTADIEGTLRYDDPATTNTGAGTPPYADIGCHEYR